MAKEKEAATPHRVLVVDDDAEIIDTVQFALKQKGYDVIIARDGRILTKQVWADAYRLRSALDEALLEKPATNPAN